MSQRLPPFQVSTVVSEVAVLQDAKNEPRGRCTSGGKSLLPLEAAAEPDISAVSVASIPTGVAVEVRFIDWTDNDPMVFTHEHPPVSCLAVAFLDSVVKLLGGRVP